MTAEEAHTHGFDTPSGHAPSVGVPTGLIPRHPGRKSVQQLYDEAHGAEGVALLVAASGHHVNQKTHIETFGSYNKPGAAVKADAGKLRWSLLPLKYLKGMLRVLTFGATKYSADNWRKGMPWTQPYNAAMRHLEAWVSGEDLDPETGESHISHAQCCLLFLTAYIEEHKNLDDRFKG